MDDNVIAEGTVETRTIADDIPESISRSMSTQFVVQDDGTRIDGEVTVEYQPTQGKVLTQEAANQIRKTIQSSDEADGITIERLLTDLYWRLVEALYIGFSSRDAPWEVVPMIVTIEWETRAGKISGSEVLGSYR